MVTVAMSVMMRFDPAKKTLLKVTMSMITTMTTILHRDLEYDWSICFHVGLRVSLFVHAHSLLFINQVAPRSFGNRASAESTYSVAILRFL